MWACCIYLIRGKEKNMIAPTHTHTLCTRLLWDSRLLIYTQISEPHTGHYRNISRYMYNSLYTVHSMLYTTTSHLYTLSHSLELSRTQVFSWCVNIRVIWLSEYCGYVPIIYPRKYYTEYLLTSYLQLHTYSVHNWISRRHSTLHDAGEIMGNVEQFHGVRGHVSGYPTQ